MRLISLVTLVLLMAAPTSARAQEGLAVIDAVTRCRVIKEEAARLGCYDRASAALASARSDNGLVVMDRKEVREKRRSLFGLTLPDINLFGRNDAKEPEINEIVSAVASVRPVGRGYFVVGLTDGSSWRTTEPAKFDPETGDEVVVRRAALGSFRASFAKAFPVRVERVR